MKHCVAKYRELDNIHPVAIGNFSPMTWKNDNRWAWRDLPKIIDNGLWYPLLYYKVSPEWWNTKFASWKSAQTESWEKINPPTVCEDGLIWALKMGTNRLQALKFMGFTSVDAVCFPNSDELVKVGLYLREKDPYNDV